jgi:hypothetical protein
MLVQSDYDIDYFNGGGGIGGYTNYNPTTYYYERANDLAITFLTKAGLLGQDLSNIKILVLGCAYGYLVKELIDQHGADVYGMDWSSYAISRVDSSIASKVIVGDIKSSTDWDTIRTLAGLNNQGAKFDVIIECDVFCCLTDAEAITARDLALNSTKSRFVHIGENTPHATQWYNWHTIAEWKALLGISPKEKWYTRYDWLEQ